MTIKNRKKKKFEPQIFKEIKKYFKGTPRIRVIAREPKDDEKAEMLKKLIEYNWPEIESRFNKEIVQPMTRCFLYGSHKWTGYGVKDRHICKICGWKTWTINDPKYMGFGKVEWDKPKSK